MRNNGISYKHTHTHTHAWIHMHARTHICIRAHTHMGLLPHVVLIYAKSRKLHYIFCNKVSFYTCVHLGHYMWNIIICGIIYNHIKNIKCSETAKYLETYKFYKKMFQISCRVKKGLAAGFISLILYGIAKVGQSQLEFFK